MELTGAAQRIKLTHARQQDFMTPELEANNPQRPTGVAVQRVVSWRLLKSGGVAHAVQEPRYHQTMWTAICGIGGHDGGESNADKCKNCIRKLKPANEKVQI